MPFSGLNLKSIFLGEKIPLFWAKTTRKGSKIYSFFEGNWQNPYITPLRGYMVLAKF